MGEKTSSALTVTLPSDREIVLTRIFEAPRGLVFEAMTRPEHLARWWGPRGSKLTVCEIDLRPGGAWRYVLRGPDGIDYPFKGVYREIVRPERIVTTECFDNPSIGSPEWLATMVLEEHDGRTKMMTTCLHPSVEARDGHLKSGMEGGAGETLDRLEELLRTMA
ncbi:MAG: hypothetical protein JWO38_3667 [Gemmataceae bacterium]|nr:hypothetical protein [Gemmataceae bacterium]